MAPLPTVTQSVTTFVTLYSLAGAATAAPAAFTKTNQSKLKLALQRIIVHSRRNVRIALAPVILPIVYRLTQNWYLRRHPDPIDASHKRAIHKFYPKDILPVLVSSPVFLLLPKGFRVQVALYFLSTYCYTFVTLDESNECEEDAQDCAKPKSKSFKWRKYVPPIWTLSAAADAWLLWALLFENYSFPEGYGKIIFDHSRKYVPANRTIPEILSALTATRHPPSPKESPHSYLLCEILHPNQISCTKNFIAACAEESKRAAPWVGGFSALSILLSGRLRSANRGWFRILFEIIDSTLRGTLHVAGTITTAWGLACLLQRVLPVGFMPKARWLINGSLPNVWILLLSHGRQTAISLYQARLAVHSMWKVWLAKGGWSIRHGEIFLIALAWIGLLRIRDRTKGGRINGAIGQGLCMVDGTEFEKVESQKGTSRPKPGGCPESCQHGSGSNCPVHPSGECVPQVVVDQHQPSSTDTNPPIQGSIVGSTVISGASQVQQGATWEFGHGEGYFVTSPDKEAPPPKLSSSLPSHSDISGSVSPVNGAGASSSSNYPVPYPPVQTPSTVEGSWTAVAAPQPTPLGTPGNQGPNSDYLRS